MTLDVHSPIKRAPADHYQWHVTYFEQVQTREVSGVTSAFSFPSTPAVYGQTALMSDCTGSPI